MTSSSGFSQLIEIHPDDRKSLLWFRTLCSLLAALAVYQTPLPWEFEIALQVAIAGTLLFKVSQALRTGPDDGLRRAVLSPEGRWQLTFGGQSPVQAELIRSWGATLGPVIGLEWRTEQGRVERLWLLRHSTPEPVWRRLRVRLHLS